MKKNLNLFIGIIILFVLVITLTIWFTRVPDFSTLSPAEITVIALPSPPDIFTIIKPQDIEKVMIALRDDTYKKSIFPAEKGWEISLSYPGTEIQLIDKYITVNGKTFYAADDLTSKIKQILIELGYLTR